MDFHKQIKISRTNEYDMWGICQLAALTQNEDNVSELNNINSEWG
jgi:hypothetical protein